ncbi:MAG TPA: 50S ribosomal protein L11 methyltransferase, partial [Lysobacter sp.]
MPFLELSLPCTEREQPRYERALEDVGALAVTLADAHADAPDEQAIFEPGVGEQPLWGELVLTALFPAGTPEALLLHALAAADEGLDWSAAQFREVPDQDWERAWMDQYGPLQFGARTWIVPWNR